VKKIGLIIGYTLSISAYAEFNCHREDFPVLYQKKDNKQLAFLDSGATSQKPNQVIDTISDTYRYASANIHRGDYTLSLKATRLYEKARITVANFLNANTNEIVFTNGSTEGINFIASTWGEKFLQSGDEIVVTEMEHNSNLLPWAMLAQRKNLVLKLIEVTQEGYLDLESMVRLITPKTKLVSCLHTSNAIGTTNPIEKIIAAAHAVGAKVLIDGAQSVPYERIDVKALDMDFLVFSGHKMLAPTGIGVLYIKKDLIDSIPAYQWGGGMADKVQLPFENTIYHPAPEGLEAGTPPIVQAIGLGAAIDYLTEKVFTQPIKEYLASLCARLIDGLEQIPVVDILGPKEQLRREGHAVAFNLKCIPAKYLAEYLDKNFNIAVRTSKHCAHLLALRLNYPSSIRCSFYFYNTPEEVDRLLAGIQSFVEERYDAIIEQEKINPTNCDSCTVREFA